MSRLLLTATLLLLGACNSGQDKASEESIHQRQKEQYADMKQVQEPVEVQAGIDVLFDQRVKELYGKNIGIVINHMAVDKQGVHLVDRILEHDQVNLKAIFGPEHGYRGDAADGQRIKNGVDPVSGAWVYSLYGQNRKPTPEMLEGIDVLIYDIQDVGVRFYTYISTMGYAMQAAAEQGIEFWVLDRPNPITGTKVEGPMLHEGFESFVGLYPIPVRYGMTIGELARMVIGEQWLDFPQGFQPEIVELEGWNRQLWLDETTVPWVAPSPNMSRMNTATVYPGMCFIEGTNISEGRGTDHPFEWIGAPWINGKQLAQELNKHELTGVVFTPIVFTPEDIPGRAMNSKYRGEQCEGVKIDVTRRDPLNAVAMGVTVIATVRQMYPEKFEWRRSSIDRLYGSDQLRTASDQGESVSEIVAGWKESLEEFRASRLPYLLYPES